MPRNPPRRSGPLSLCAAAMFLLLVLAGCREGSSSTGSPTLRVVNAAYRAPANFDVLVNSASVATNLAFGSATTFANTTAGSVSVQFDPTGTKTASYTASVVTVGSAPMSVVAVEGAAGLTALAVAQDASAVAAGQARLDLVNAAPLVPALDFYVSAPSDALPAAASATSVTYPGDAGSTTPVEVTLGSGDYRIRAVAHADANRAIVFDSGPVTLTSGADLLLLAVPTSGSAANFALLALGNGSTGFTIADQRSPVRFGNFALGAGAVDAFLDGSGAVNSPATLFAQGVAGAATGTYQNVLPGAYRASIAATTTTTELVGTAVVLAPGAPVSVLATGVGTAGTAYGLQLLALRDNLVAPATGFAALRVVALAPDLGKSDIVVLDVSGITPVITRRLAVQLAYTGASSYLTLAAGNYTIAVVPTGMDVPLLPATGAGFSLASGSVYTLVAAGCEHPATGICAASSAALGLTLLQDR